MNALPLKGKTLICLGLLLLIGLAPKLSAAANTTLETATSFTAKRSDRIKLEDLFKNLCWVAYSPTSFDPTTDPIQWPSKESVREDLQVLRSAGFNGLVTYGAKYRDRNKSKRLLDIPRLAQKTGFNAMIVGVWDPTDEEELQAAERASRYSIVIGYSIGNEGLDVRYNLKTLTTTIDRIRETTGKPVTTTEEVGDYLSEDSPLRHIGDWIFPNVHPYFASLRNPQEAVRWTAEMFDIFRPFSPKPLIFKEVGLPSSDGSPTLTERDQAQYYKLLKETGAVYVVFEAFDAPWKHLSNPQSGIDPEPHWGIFRSDRLPKEAAADICPARP